MSIYLNKIGKNVKGLNATHCLKLLSSNKYKHKLFNENSNEKTMF